MCEVGAALQAGVTHVSCLNNVSVKRERETGGGLRGPRLGRKTEGGGTEGGRGWEGAASGESLPALAGTRVAPRRGVFLWQQAINKHFTATCQTCIPSELLRAVRRHTQCTC